MTKSDLIAAMAANANISKDQAAKALEAFESSLTSAVANDGRFSLPGVGTFKKAKRGARSGTTKIGGAQKTWNVPAHNTVTFKAAPGLKEAVN